MIQLSYTAMVCIFLLFGSLANAGGSKSKTTERPVVQMKETEHCSHQGKTSPGHELKETADCVKIHIESVSSGNIEKIAAPFRINGKSISDLVSLRKELESHPENYVNLKEVDLGGFKKPTFELFSSELSRILEILAKQAKALEILRIPGLKFSQKDAAWIAQLASLKTLDLANTGVGDNHFSQLEKLTKLENLNLTGAKVTHRFLPHLEKLHNLRNVTIAKTYFQNRFTTEWAIEAAEAGNTIAQAWAGAHYKDLVKEGNAEKIAEAVEAVIRPDNNYDLPQNEEKLLEKTRTLLEKASEKGNAYAKNVLGIMYGTEMILDEKKESDQEAVKYFREAAELDETDAFFNLGFMLDHARVPRDDVAGLPDGCRIAEDCFVKAASRGQKEARAYLERAQREQQEPSKLPLAGRISDSVSETFYGTPAERTSASLLKPKVPKHVETLPVTINNRPAMLKGNLYKNNHHDHGKKVVIFFAGTGDPAATQAKEVIEYLTHAKIDVLVVDYRGFGNSTGTPTEDGLYSDGNAMVKYLRSQGYSDDQMTLWGYSMGGAVGSRVATKNPKIKTIIFDRTIESTASATAAHQGKWIGVPAGYISRKTLGEFNTRKNLREIVRRKKNRTNSKENILFILAGKDPLAPAARELAKDLQGDVNTKKYPDAQLVQISEAVVEDAVHEYTGTLKILLESCFKILRNLGLSEDAANKECEAYKHPVKSHS